MTPGDATMRRVDAVVGLTARLAVRSGRRRRPAPPVDRDLRLVVSHVRAEAPDVAGLTLLGSGPLPAWRPGAHLDVVLPSGLVRQYSLCGDPARRGEYRIAVRRAVPAGHAFHAERFSPPPIRDGRPFTLTLRDGTAVPVPADRSALDAVLAVRPDLAFSCRQGFCGTCHVPLLAGATEHDPAGPGRTAICVARAVGDAMVVDA